MILLDDVEYTINTPQENADAMVQRINQWCSDHAIKNKHDELVQITANYANPLYIILFGLGYLMSAAQNLIYSAGCALSIQASSDKQLLNIADVAGVKRKEPTKTTITCIVYSQTGVGAVPCRVTTTLTLTVTVAGAAVEFHPAYDVTIPVGEARPVVLIADVLGAYSIAEGTITSFDENPEGFRTMYNYASVPGQDQETIASLRQRIQRRTETGSLQDKAVEAIGQLPGVSVCNIYFNNSVTATETVMGIAVPPRQSLIFVQGFSLDIAKTYWSYMNAQCAGSTSGDAITQVYRTNSGQELPVYIFTPEQRVVYIRLYFNSVVPDEEAQQMRDKIATLASSLTIGQRLTSTQVVDVVQENFVTEPAGCQLSLDDQAYGYQVQPGPYELLVFNVDTLHIQVIGQEA